MKKLLNVILLLLTLNFILTNGQSTNPDLQSVIASLTRNATFIQDTVEDWFNYEYDSTRVPVRSIVDGGDDLFDTGNQVRYFETGDPSLYNFSTYNQTTSFDNSEFVALATLPFMALAFIRNQNETGDTFSIEVSGNLGADGAGAVATSSGFIYKDEARISYHVVQYFGTGDPTIGELYFAIDNTEAWNSSVSFGFQLVQSSSSTESSSTLVRVDGSPRNVLMGYILLTKSDQTMFSQTVITNIINNILFSLFGPNEDNPLRVPLFSNQIRTIDPFGVINGFYRYLYDEQGSNIQNGGMDMFNNGNRIRFYQDQNDPGSDAIYNRLIRLSNSEFLTNSIGFPFFALAWISDKDIDHTYTLQVYGGIGNGNGRILEFDGFIEYGNSFARYYVWSSSQGSTPSVYQVFFVIENQQLWNSSTGYNFEFEYNEPAPSIYNATVRLTGQPENVLMGYLLLSRQNGAVISGTQVTSLLDDIMIALDQRYCQNTVCLDFDEIVDDIFSFTPQIRDIVPDWFNYEYPSGVTTSLLDGGNDIFDTGNKVYFNEMAQTRRLATYNVRYMTERDYIFEANSWHPFVALMLIENPRMETKDFEINVEGNLGADGLGSIEVTNGNLSSGNFNASYHKWLVYGARDPSVCEVYFVIYNVQDWGSVPPESFSLDAYSTNTDASNTVVRVSGSSQNVLLGYTLLSSLRGEPISDKTVERALRLIIFSLQPEGTRSTLAPFNITDGSTIAIPTRRPTTRSSTTRRTTNNITVTTETQSTTTLAPTLTSKMLERIVSNLTANPRLISDLVNNWYNYIYDSVTNPETQIGDGGLDLFDNGNEVQYFENRIVTGPAIYNQSRRYSNSEFTIVATHPFMALSWITNNTERSMSYTIQVTGNLGADGNGQVFTSSGFVFHDSARASYHVVQYAMTGDPTIAELYFVIENQEVWNSSSDVNTFTLASSTLTTSVASTIVRLTGNPNNVLMSYMLLVRDTQEPFEATLIESIMSSILTALFGPQETTNEVVSLLNQVRSINQSNAIQNFNRYNYDGQGFNIQDGGNNLFNDGNRINFYENDNNLDVPITYNNLMRFSNSEFVTSTTGYPFYALAWILDNEINPTYTLQVYGGIGIKNAQTTNIQGSIEYGNSLARYFVWSSFMQSNLTISELFFVIENQQLWNSTGEYEFRVVNFSENPSISNTTVQLSGEPKNVLMGYALLSSSSGISPIEITNFLDDIMIALDQRQCLNEVCVDFDKIVDDIFLFTPQMRDAVPNFYRYLYDNPNNNSIADGSNDIFDNGNLVFFDDGAVRQSVVYDVQYTNDRDLIFESNQWHPFMALMFVENPRKFDKSFSITVQGNLGADGFGELEVTNGTVDFGGFNASYHKVLVWDASDPSVCEVYFLISNQQLWGSVEPEKFSLLDSNRDSNTQNSTATIFGRSQNVLLGYMLLSSMNGGYISDQVVESTIRLIISAMQPEELRTSPGQMTPPPPVSTTSTSISTTSRPPGFIPPGSRFGTTSSSTSATTSRPISETTDSTTSPFTQPTLRETTSDVEATTTQEKTDLTTSGSVGIKLRFVGLIGGIFIAVIWNILLRYL